MDIFITQSKYENSVRHPTTVVVTPTRFHSGLASETSLGAGSRGSKSERIRGSRFLQLPDWKIHLGVKWGERPFEIISRPLIYRSDVLGRNIVVPEGYRTDFYSTPWIVRRSLPQGGLGRYAAVVHDWLCDEDPKTTDFVTAAKVFREAMKNLGVGKIKRNLMYSAVIVGGPKFQKGDQKEGLDNPQSVI
jgi:hypothetical protein